MEIALRILTDKLGKEIAEKLILKYYQKATDRGFKNADVALVLIDWHEEDLADEKFNQSK